MSYAIRKDACKYRICNKCDMYRTELEKYKWIPVSERLPETQQRVLVSLKHAPIVVGWLMWDEWYTDYGKGYGNVEVIAWQPLPQPYKEGNNG